MLLNYEWKHFQNFSFYFILVLKHNLTFQVEVDNDTLEPKSELTSAAKDWCEENGIKGKTIEEVMAGADYAR